MDFDFHYYATQGAARISGWDEKDANIIANAALFIDYCDWSTFGYYFSLDDKRELGFPVLTSQFATWTELLHKADCSIWTPFHFLPGNFIPTSGPVYNEGLHKVRKTKKDSTNVEYLCRPYSSLVKKMMDHTHQKYNKIKDQDRITALNLVGVRMHTFIDTWAHQDFCGFDNSINDCGLSVKQRVYEKDGQKKIKKLDIVFTEKFASDRYDFEAAPPGANIGHGRMGHLPDMSWLQMYYQPEWLLSDDNSDLEGYCYRDNPQQYQEAFLNMISELCYIRTGTKKFIEIVDSSKMNTQQIKDLLGKNSDSNKIQVPSVFIDILAKPRKMGGLRNGAFPQAANAWADTLKELGLLTKDFLRGEKDSFPDDWEKTLKMRFKAGFDVQTESVWPIYSYATLKKKADALEDFCFLSFQEAAALHLDFVVNAIQEEPKLAGGVKEIKDAWSYKYNEFFRKYATNKFK